MLARTTETGRLRSAGFTLVELMIVVGIIGILAAIAVPSFRKFQGKSRQSEAKISLKAYFTAAKATYAETQKWRCGSCGWSPQEGDYLYNYFLGDVSFTKSQFGCAEGLAAPAKQTDPNMVTGEHGGFTAEASANLDTDPTCDAWYINDAADLENPSNDVEY